MTDAPIWLEQATVGRKTPRDGRLELTAASALRVGAPGAPIALDLDGRAGTAQIETMECTCGKAAGLRPGESHLHHFVSSPLFRELEPGAPVRLELDAHRPALLARVG